MACVNCSCPFFEQHVDNGVLGSAGLNCVVRDAVKEVHFFAGDVLFAQGQLSTSLYSVSRGIVKITSTMPDGREQIVGLAQPGKLLVGLQSITDNSYEYSAVAATEVAACKIGHRAMLTSVSDDPDIAMRLVAALNAQLAYSRALMEVMGQQCAAAKIASFLMLVTPKSLNGNGQFVLPFSRKEIAGLLGLSEETVCRQMANLKRQGVIHAPRGTVRIKDRRALQAIADGVSA